MCEQRIQQHTAEQVAEQIRQVMEQVARCNGALISFTVPPSAPPLARFRFVALLVTSAYLYFFNFIWCMQIQVVMYKKNSYYEFFLKYF